MSKATSTERDKNVSRHQQLEDKGELLRRGSKCRNVLQYNAGLGVDLIECSVIKENGDRLQGAEKHYYCVMRELTD